ncbi:MAG: hypothetical protein QM709_02565 [Spongiibacteraceae bacterium]
MNIAFVFASCVLLIALTLTAVAVNQLLKSLRESLMDHPFGAWLTQYESALLLSVWAAIIAALFFFGPNLIMLVTARINATIS